MRDMLVSDIPFLFSEFLADEAENRPNTSQLADAINAGRDLP